MSVESATHASGASRETRSHIWEIYINVTPVTRVTSCYYCLDCENTHCSACKDVIVDSMRVILSNRLQTSTLKPPSVSYVSAQYIPFTNDSVRPTIRVDILVQCGQIGISRIRHWVGKEAEIRPIFGHIQKCEAYSQFMVRKDCMDWITITFGTIKIRGGKRPSSSAVVMSQCFCNV